MNTLSLEINVPFENLMVSHLKGPLVLNLQQSTCVFPMTANLIIKGISFYLFLYHL